MSGIMLEPTVSVIIPCYHSSKHVRKTIDSVLMQDYKNLKIVTVDDGSKDETINVLEGYLPKIRVLRHPNNAHLGEGASLNLGIRETKSNLIAFLDHDDVWHPHKVRDQVKIFQEHSDVGLVYTNGYAIDEEDNILYRLHSDDFREKNIRGEILLRCYITQSSVMVRRQVFERIGLFRTDFYSTDHDMWVRMSEVTKFYYLPDLLTIYRKHAGSKSLKREMWENGFAILREACKRDRYGFGMKRKRLAVLYYRLGEHDWSYHNYLRALKNYILAGAMDPIRGLSLILKG